jgi:flagellar biosynthesis component FlhA
MRRKGRTTRRNKDVVSRINNEKDAMKSIEKFSHSRNSIKKEFNGERLKYSRGTRKHLNTKTTKTSKGMCQTGYQAVMLMPEQARKWVDTLAYDYEIPPLYCSDNKTFLDCYYCKKIFK